MKLTATLGLILVCLHACTAEAHVYAHKVDPLRSNTFADFLEKFKTILKEGDDTRGIPIMDPLAKEDEFSIKINDDQIQLDVLLKDTYVLGLSEYDVKIAKTQLMNMQFTVDLIWPMVIASLAYEIVEGNVNGLKCSGSGDIALIATNLNIALDVQLELVNGENLKVKTVSSKLALEALNFEINGLMIDNEDISDNLNALAHLLPRFIKTYHEEYAKKVNKVTAKMLNICLVDKTVDDVMRFIEIIP